MTGSSYNKDIAVDKRVGKLLLVLFCIGDEPKSGIARDLGDCLQFRNVPFGTSGD